MKKVLPLLALGAVVASASVQAKGNWYVGADLVNSDLKVKACQKIFLRQVLALL